MERKAPETEKHTFEKEILVWVSSQDIKTHYKTTIIKTCGVGAGTDTWTKRTQEPRNKHMSTNT